MKDYKDGLNGPGSKIEVVDTTQKELRKKWIEALRSDKYKQGREQLRKGKDRFCCLGVLCDVFDNGQWKLDSDIFGTIYFYNSNDKVPPISVCDAVGFRKAFRNASVIADLANLNDREGLSFSEIADLLEEHPERFFTDEKEVTE